MEWGTRARVEAEVYGFMTERGLPGLAVSVAEGGEPPERWILGRADASSGRPLQASARFRWASITKTLTAVALARWVARGEIDWDAPVREVAPGVSLLRDPAWSDVLVGHLLTHTSGIGEIAAVGSLRHPLWAIGGVRPGMRTPSLTEYCAGGFRCEAPPEERWAYSNPAFCLLGSILERVSGDTFDCALIGDVAEPLGLKGLTLSMADVDPEDVAAGHRTGSGPARRVRPYEIVTIPAGAAVGTIDDLETWAEFVLSGARSVGSSLDAGLLDADSWGDLVRVQYRSHPAMPSTGLGFWLSDIGGFRVIGHGGTVPGYTSQFAVVPERGLSVCVLGNKTFYPSAYFGAGHLASRLLHVLLDVPFPEESLGDPSDADDEAVADVCGVYRVEPGILTSARAWQYFGGQVTIERRGSALVARALTGPFRRGLVLRPVTGGSGDRSSGGLPLSFAATYDGYTIPLHFEASGEGSRPDTLHTGFPPCPFRLRRTGTSLESRAAMIAVGAGLAGVGAGLAWRRLRRE